MGPGKAASVVQAALLLPLMAARDCPQQLERGGVECLDCPRLSADDDQLTAAGGGLLLLLGLFGPAGGGGGYRAPGQGRDGVRQFAALLGAPKQLATSYDRAGTTADCNSGGEGEFRPWPAKAPQVRKRESFRSSPKQYTSANINTSGPILSEKQLAPFSRHATARLGAPPSLAHQHRTNGRARPRKRRPAALHPD